MERLNVPQVRVVIIDEHEPVRQALEARLRSSPEVEVVGSAGSWQEGVLLAAERAADVVLLETKRADAQGLAALRRLRAECPRTAVVVLTSYSDAEERQMALTAGAARYLLKEIGSTYLVQEILAIARPSVT